MTLFVARCYAGRVTHYKRRHLCNRPAFEQGSQRKLQIKSFRDAISDADRRQRMPAQIEEVIVNADCLDLQHLFPHSREFAFES